MLIPLGILAASGAGVAGSYELIETYTVGSGGIASVTFNVSSYNTTYQHLQLRVGYRSNNAADSDDLNLRFNADTGNNYAWHYLGNSGTSGVSSAAVPSTNSIVASVGSGNNQTANSFGSAVIDILDPYEAKNKTVRSLSGVTGNFTRVFFFSGLWNNTTAVSSIVLSPRNGTSFSQYSRFSIYGLKAS